MGLIVKSWMRFLLILTLVWGIAGCGSLNKVEQLPPVAPLATPQMPDWIEQISPTGSAEPLAQIRIRFKDPLIPVESLDSPEQQAKLKQFEIQPALPGQFRFLTPRMVGFQPERALPKATRIQITLKAGLEDLKNHRLAQDLAWTFNTDPIKLSNLPATKKSPYADPEPIDLKPTLKFTSNVELDLASVAEHLKLVPAGGTSAVGLDVAPEKAEEQNRKGGETAPDPESKFDPSARTWNYTIIPRQSLEKGTRYRLEFSPGLRPARGNLPTENTFASEVETYAPLAFKEIKYAGQPDAGGVYGRFVKGSALLQFNNGLVADSALQNIAVTPAPKKEPRLVQAVENQSAVSLNPWALEPATTYTITIGANLKDKFGQTLGKPVTVKYETGDMAADIWAPEGLNIFPAGKDLQLNISAVNLPDSQYKAGFKVVQPADLVYTNSAYPREGGYNLLPNTADWQSVRVSGKKNQSAEIAVPLREKLNSPTGLLAYGVRARTNRYQENGLEKWREPAFYGMVQLTNLGVFAQWFPESGLVRVHHLSDGSPAAGAPVEIYQSKLEAKSQPKPAPCATGKTDKTGTLLLSRQDLQQCLNSQSAEKPPELLVIARENKDWAFARTQEYSGAYGYGIYAGWDAGKPQSRGTIFSDRQLYQPGETAWLTGAAYYLQNGTLKQDKNVRYTVTLESPDGSKTNLGAQTANDFGTFSLEVPVKPNQPLGYYSVRAKGDSGAEITGQFRVAEFKPPNFKVELSLDREFALRDDKVEAKAKSTYLFGAPVEGGKVKYYVTRNKTQFTPKGWEKFSFGRQWFWPEEEPSVSSDVLQQNQVLDASGQDSLTLTAGKDLPYPMVYRVDAEVSDVSNLSVANSQTFTALPSDRLIGLQSNFVADAGKPFPIQVTVTDPAGNAIEGERVRVELQKMDYSRVTQVVEGSQNPRNQVEYKTVAQAEVKSGKSPQTVSLNPSEAGSYRIRANFAGAKDEITATDLQIWATGESAVFWGRRGDSDRLEIKLDKDTYKPGETATALIQSPYPEAELYFAVVRDKTLYRTIAKVKGGAPQIEFQVTPEMLPNAAVEAVLVRQGAPLAKVEPGSLENLVRIGFAPFKTSLDEKYLKVKVTPDKTELQPGAEETVQLELKDDRGNPIKGQFTVMVVNEAVLQLSGYRPPDLVETVYAEQSISTRFGDNRADVVLQPLSSPVQKGWGYDGGLSSGAANTRIRKDFQALAYYNPSAIADAKGRASVRFKLPDDLTTWRVMAVAASGDMRFGNGDATLIATKPLMSNPVLPQFARLGDSLEAGLSVTNTTGQKGNLAINGEVSGAVKFEKNQNRQNLQTQAEAGTRAYRFPMVAASKGEGKVRFVTQLNGTADAFEVTLPVKPLDVAEQVVETGTTDSQVKIPLNVNKNVVPDTGGLEVSLASTLIPEIGAPARQVFEEDDLPFLEPAASQLAIAANLEIFGKKYKQTFADFNSTQQADQSFNWLQKLQLPDGGFAAWPGQDKSDPFVTPYAAESLAKAKAAGFAVDSEMLSRMTAYLKNILADPGKYEFCDQLCKTQVRLGALMALAELGEKRNDFLADIYAQREQFDAVTQIKLARYLSQLPEWQDESKTLFKQLQETVNETGRSAAVNLPPGWRWISSRTTAQAQVLRLALAQKSKPEVTDRLLEGLLNLRRKGTWGSTYDNAEALNAVVEYSKTEPAPPNFTAAVKLAGKQLESAQFKGYENPSLSLNVGMTQLPRGSSDLLLQKSGKGTLHYLVAYRYRLQGNQPGRFNGLRVSREIRPANEEKVLGRQELRAPEQPLTVGSGQVFDIGLEIVTDRPVDRVVIADPLPAGFEAVDGSFQTSTPAVQAQANSWQIGYQTIYRDRVVAYADRLEPGVYTLHYLVRSVTPGTFLWPGSDVHLQYAPEEFGRSASTTLVVKE